MYLAITTTRQPATDLGYLLHKNPARPQTFDVGFGRAHVLYPEASAERCTAVLLLDVDPVAMVRGREGSAGGGAIDHYVNDRAYVASSFLSVALGRVYGTALGGRCAARPELARTPLPLTATLAALPCRGGDTMLRRLFGPLGYTVEATRQPLDERFPEWGESPYFTVTLRATRPLAELLNHLAVLVPVLDDDKHYWAGADEVDKLLRRGGDWLATHPEKELIASRYLRRDRRLVAAALERLTEEDDADPDATADAHAAEEEAVEAPLSLSRQRLAAVVAALTASGARRVLDLGCGEGRLLATLRDQRQFEQIAGLDVSATALTRAARRLRLDRLPERERDRCTLLHGSLTYRDPRLAGYDAAAVVEVIEHLDPARLTAFERVLFTVARPGTIVLTTPNAEYNATWESLPAGRFRHQDHRFEWTRAQFHAWAAGCADRHGYAVRYEPIGPDDPAHGPPTQMAVFTLAAGAATEGGAR